MTEKDINEQRMFGALSRLLRDIPIDKISVTDIAHEANVGRATFYRYFYDKYKLLNSHYDKILSRTLYRFGGDLSWRDATFAIYDEIRADLTLYQNSICSDDVNGLKNYIFRISKEFHAQLLRRGGIDTGHWKVQRALDSYIYGNLEIMCAWLREGMKEPIEEMQDVMDQAIPLPFVECIYRLDPESASAMGFENSHGTRSRLYAGMRPTPRLLAIRR